MPPIASAQTESTGPRGDRFDPWAESAPVFGRAQREHALSPHPGTPPVGTPAVRITPARRPQPLTSSFPAPAPSASVAFAPAGSGEFGARRDAETHLLRDLREPLRVEMEFDRTGKWLCGLCERASDRGAVVSLRSAIWHGFALPAVGSRVRLLVAPHASRTFSVPARIVPCNAASSSRGAFTLGLALDTNDPMTLTQWETVVAQARGT